jgi:hypothetical protein
MAPKANKTPGEIRASIDSMKEKIEKLRKKIQGYEGQREDADEGEVDGWIHEDEAEISRTELAIARLEKKLLAREQSPIVIDGEGSEARSDVDVSHQTQRSLSACFDDQDEPVAKRQKGASYDTSDQGRRPAPVRCRGGKDGRGSNWARGRGRGGATGSATPPVNAVDSGSGTTDTATDTAVPSTASTTGENASATVAKTR